MISSCFHTDNLLRDLAGLGTFGWGLAGGVGCWRIWAGFGLVGGRVLWDGLELGAGIGLGLLRDGHFRGAWNCMPAGTAAGGGSVWTKTPELRRLP